MTYRRVACTFADFSLKARRTQYGESNNEWMLFQELEIDPQVVDFQLQPLRIDWQTSDGPRSYIPDAIASYADGTVAALEMKATWRDFWPSDYAAKIAAAQNAFESIDVRFKKVVAEDLESPVTRRHNVVAAYLNRYVSVPQAKLEAALQIIDLSAGMAALAEVEEQLSPDALTSRRMSRSLIAARVIATDLDTPMASETPVQRAPVAADDCPDIRALDQ